MSNNDIIAEYVKEKYPELLTGADFAIYKTGVVLREIVNNCAESLKKIDFKELKRLADEINETKNK